MKKFLTIIFAVVFLLGGVINVSAIGISPVIYDDIAIDPGEMIIKEMEVMNNTDLPDTYYFYAKNFVPDGEEGNMTFRDRSDNVGLASWIVPEIDKMEFKAWEVKKIKFAINVPDNAEPGGHYAAFFTAKQPYDQTQASGVGLGSEVGLLLLVRVNGEVVENSNVKEFGVVKEKSAFNRLPQTFFSRIENNGSVHFKPTGTIKITNLFGRKAAEIPANPIGGNVLPHSIRRLESTWVKDSKAVVGKTFMSELTNEWNNFAIGRYKAELNMLWSTQQPALTATTTFWVFPWHVMLVALLLLIVLIIILKLYNKLVLKMAQRKKATK